VSEPGRENLRTVWRQLARRYNWALVEDEEQFLDIIAAEYDALASGKTPNDRARIAVWRAYSTLLYRGLWRREERAAQELWQALVRVALKRGQPQPEAEDMAQEVIARVVQKLPALRAPQSLLSYAMMTFRGIQREGTKSMSADQPLYADDDELRHEPADPADLAQDVEQQLTSEELQAQLRARLPNALERVTLLRIVVFGDNPRDVAHDLGLPLYRTRLAKHRALNRLRGDEAFFRFLRDLTGADGHDS
jgi:RNA polymerase sigma factor (sigma-70 family)